jgi:type VI secretion system protein ImpA
MVEVASAAPVIDLEALLQPIPGDNPSGEALQYSGLYDEIREARRADLDVSQGQWQHKLKTADFRQVISLAVPALLTQTKDLQISVWLAEALTKENGFVGMRDSLQLMDGLQQNFWETCYPEIDEGDEEGRANAIEWMDKQLSLAIQNLPLTDGSSGLSYFAWEESKRFDIPENLDSLEYAEKEKYTQIRTQAEQENRITGEMWRKAKAQSRRAFYEKLSLTIDECWTAYQSLDKTIEEKFDPKQTPGMNLLKKTLDDIRTAVQKMLQEKRLEEPDPSDAGVNGDGLAETNGDGSYEGGISANGGSGGGVATASGAIRSRQDALKRLSDVADFFRQTEPHSPVSYLVQRAVKWGNMPLSDWLGEVIKDTTVLGSLRETLGVTPGENGGDGGSSDGSYSADSTNSW